MTADSVLALAGDDDPSTQSSKVFAFRFILFMAVITENLLMASTRAANSRPGVWLLAFSAAILAICLTMTGSEQWARPASLVAALLLLAQYAAVFPRTANHDFLALVCMGLLCSFDMRRSEERETFLRTLRWITVLALFYTGFQKALYGLYFHGQFLSYEISRKESYSSMLQHLLPQEELAHLISLGLPAPGTGPYRSHSLPFLMASNATMLLEMGLPFLLMIRRTRWVGALGVIALLAIIEVGAREFMFGVIFINLVLTFFQKDVNRRLLPAIAFFLIALLLTRAYFAPSWFFV